MQEPRGPCFYVFGSTRGWFFFLQLVGHVSTRDLERGIEKKIQVEVGC